MLNNEKTNQIAPAIERNSAEETAQMFPKNLDDNENRENGTGLLSRLRAIRSQADEDTKTDLEYHYTQCFIALAIHYTHIFLGPISIPLLFYIFGKPLCTNLGYGKSRFYWREFSLWLWTLLIILFWSLNSQDFAQWQCLIFTSICTEFLRTTLVSLKYGYFTIDRWNLMKMEFIDSTKLVKEYIATWIKIPTEIIDHELMQAVYRLNKTPNELCVSFDVPLADMCKEAMLKFQYEYGIEITHKNLVQHKGNECISTFLFSRAIIDYVVKVCDTKLEMNIIRLLSMIYCTLPFIVRYLMYGSIQSTDPLFIIFSIYSSVLNYYFGSAFMGFVYVGVFDFRRKKMLMDECTSLISDIENEHTFSYEHSIPLLNMKDVRTIESWYIMRNVFLDFGRKYTYRLFLYSGLVLPLCLVVLGFVVLQILGVMKGIYSSSLVAIFFLIIVCLIFIILMILTGVELNRMFAIHRDLLLNIMELLVKEGAYKNDETLQSALKILELEVKKLEQDELLRPIKIMGMRTDSVFFAKMLAVFFSGLVAMGQLYLKNSSGSII